MAPSSSTMPTDRKRVIGELTRGREMADQLRLMLRDQTGPDARGLVGKVLDSFTRSILILGAAAGDSDEVSQAPAAAGLKPEDSGESCKRPAAQKDRRGCYKRRRSLETWIKESSSLFEDGYAWRKYGQKVILNAKHPRNYYRCTHKYDQGCQASKQVQMCRDEPPLYRTTYHGQHSCKNILKQSPHQIIIDAATQDDSPVIWSFGSGQPQDHYKLGDGDLVIDAIKQENKEEENKDVKLSNHDYFDTCSQLAAAFSSGSADHGGDVLSSDVYSCTASTHSMEFDMMDSVFDDFLELESLT
ncbi:probable WRKY transcription factor 70 [Phtheirospermum japonicum]|uniref:Probable WRKY transcription factor 70 n=1 Tax=Phtheirospermum japonicum TaxID=374723 RepID=A0A830BR26_9LAMI|nr:probable WRKY transcription factor 70 [Phtheirospermum japonicum]